MSLVSHTFTLILNNDEAEEKTDCFLNGVAIYQIFLEVLRFAEISLYSENILPQRKQFEGEKTASLCLIAFSR